MYAKDISKVLASLYRMINVTIKCKKSGKHGMNRN